MSNEYSALDPLVLKELGIGQPVAEAKVEPVNSLTPAVVEPVIKPVVTPTALEKPVEEIPAVVAPVVETPETKVETPAETINIEGLGDVKLSDIKEWKQSGLRQSD